MSTKTKTNHENTKKEPKIISVFNNKGGVGKTTYLYHLAHLIAEQGKKVLCVDCDSQCNLTAYCIGADKMLHSNKINKENTIYQAISPFINSMEDFKDVAFDKISRYPNNGGVDLIQGDLSLSDFEDRLGRSYLSMNHASEIYQQIAIYNYLLKVGHNYDFILIDLGPNLGALNRSILNSSDYIITPMSPDMFSIQATENLGRKMKEWSEEWDTFVKDLDKSRNAIIKQSLSKPGLDIKLPLGRPKFLGYILQRFTTSGTGRVMNVAFQTFANMIDFEIERNIVAVIPDQIHEIERKNSPTRFCIGEIEDLKTAVPWSMRLLKPFYEIKSGDKDTYINYKGEEVTDRVPNGTLNMCENQEIKAQWKIGADYILSL